MAIYSTYQGIFSDYEVEGWYILENRECVKETLDAGSVRAYAFATFDEKGLMTPIEFWFRVRSRDFSRSTREVCIPVQERPDPFKFSTSDMQGSAPPCSEGYVSIPASLNILGGNSDEQFEFYLDVPADRSAEPDAAYAAAMKKMFGKGQYDLLPEVAVERSDERTARYAADLETYRKPIQRYCNGSDIFSHRLMKIYQDKIDLCRDWAIWQEIVVTQRDYGKQIKSIRHQCRSLITGIPYSVSELVVKWPNIMFYEVIGMSYHEVRCERRKAELRELTNGRSDDDPLEVATRIHHRLFDENLIRKFID